MKLKKIAFGFLLPALLACSTVTNMVMPPTATLTPSATMTLTPSPTPTLTATPLVPAYIPPECETASLATVAPDFVAPTPDLSFDEISKDQQLEILNQIDDIVRDVYVYPDFNGKDWNEIETRYKSKVEAGLGVVDFYYQMASMINELGDEHSVFLSPLDVEAMEDELKGENSFVGIGVYSVAENGRLVVISTFPDSVAERAGIKMHDSILRVDGRPVLDDHGDHLHGPACSTLVVTVQSPGEAPRDLVLVRQTIKSNLEIESHLVPTQDGSKIGYLFIPTFFDETIPAQVQRALQDFGQLDGLILDVRMNSGGINTVADPILSFFTDGRLGQFVSRNESRPMAVRAYPVNNSQTVPIVVIVNKDTISYGEIFAGIMRDSRDAKITGETSLGNVEVLHSHFLADGSELLIASEAFYPAHSDENWEESGIIPDLEATADWSSFTFETDPSIAAGLTLLGH